MEGVVYKVKGPEPNCTIPALSNLVDLWRTPDVGQVYHRPTTSSKPLQSRSQRCFSQFDRITQTRQGRSLNKYQRCSQSVLMDGDWGLPYPVVTSKLAGPSFKALWQKSAQDPQPSVSAVLELEPTWNGDLSTRYWYLPNVERAGNMPEIRKQNETAR